MNAETNGSFICPKLRHRLFPERFLDNPPNYSLNDSPNYFSTFCPNYGLDRSFTHTGFYFRTDSETLRTADAGSRIESFVFAD
jgi:hypothetical protein